MAIRDFEKEPLSGVEIAELYFWKRHRERYKYFLRNNKKRSITNDVKTRFGSKRANRSS